MAATLDTVARLLEELIEETRLTRMVYEAHQCGPVAPPDDMEDPTVAFDPFDWSGASMKGELFSACSPDFLDCIARSLTNMAQKDKREKKVTSKGAPTYIYSLQRAARARRWAIRLRCGWLPPEKPDTGMAASEGLGATGLGAMDTGMGLGESAMGTTATMGSAMAAAPLADTDFPFGANETAVPASDGFEDSEDDDDLAL